MIRKTLFTNTVFGRNQGGIDREELNSAMEGERTIVVGGKLMKHETEKQQL